MATDLRDGLRDLADHSPPAGPPPDLWARGVRRRRMSQVGMSVLVAGLVLILGLGAWTWRNVEQRVQPAGSNGTPQLPSQFFTPSPWLHTFGRPPGELVTVIPAEQKTLLHTTLGLVGVTAAGATYGFLDLPPDAVLDGNIPSAFALSPDGGRLAFWMSGTPTGGPNTVQYGVTITALGTYDTVTGHVRTYSIPTAHGVSPSLLLWASDDTLSFAYSQIQGGDGSGDASASAHHAGRGVWTTADAQPSMVPGGERPSFLDNTSTRAADGSLVAPSPRDHTWVLMSSTGGSRLTKFRTRPGTTLLVPSPDLTRVVAVPGGDRSETGPLAVAALPGPGSVPGTVVRLHRVPGALRGWFRPLAWVDDYHVAALRRVVLDRGDGGKQVFGEIELVDLRTGVTHTLVQAVSGGGSEGSDAWLATDLLRAPSVRAVRPPSPPNLRDWGVALGVAFLLILLVGGTAVRGRAGRRA